MLIHAAWCPPPALCPCTSEAGAPTHGRWGTLLPSLSTLSGTLTREPLDRWPEPPAGRGHPQKSFSWLLREIGLEMGGVGTEELQVGFEYFQPQDSTSFPTHSPQAGR